MAGRKSKYTPETVDKLTQAIRLGATYQLACDYAGIHIDTFYQWQKTHSGFSEAIKLAEGDGAIRLLAVIERAANGLKGEDGEYILAPTWQAAAWKLERRYPQMYGRQAVEISGPDGGAIVVKGYANVTPDDWQAPAERPDDSDV
jgi:transposase